MIRRKLKNSVDCEICKKSLKVINKEHLRTHNITVEEYENKFGKKRYSDFTLYKLGCFFRDKKRPEHSKRMMGEKNPIFGKKRTADEKNVMKLKVKLVKE